MQLQSSQSASGYTLVEILIVVAIIGILSAIAAPSWLSLLNRLRLNAAQAEALTVMREAQVKAKQEKRVWEACFFQNEADATVQWSVHPVKSDGQICSNASWQNLIGEDAGRIAIDTSSTFYHQSNVYRVQFNYKGWVNGRLGKITFILRAERGRETATKRCAIASTLLGAIRTAQNNECRRS